MSFYVLSRLGIFRLFSFTVYDFAAIHDLANYDLAIHDLTIYDLAIHDLTSYDLAIHDLAL